MHAIVPFIIIAIIALQIFFFVKNLLRMKEFGTIFEDDFSWRLRHDINTGLVDGVLGSGNSIFNAIKDSINKYLGNNSGSVIDFNLLKDAVDRHCDSVENDISTQTPIPLYWGLAGTMAGVILGLGDLLSSGAILTLMDTNIDVNSGAEQAARGIDALLSGVAWAMVASIVGILFTTINSILFKNCKLKQENGKNSFLAWMQAELLPKLPSDTSEALNNLVKNLNKFNKTFAQNTSNLGDALSEVNKAYAYQAEIIQAVHDMDVVKMAKANTLVLKELQECTGKLEEFNQYLMDINGYTKAIHAFEKMFRNEAGRLNVLEEIRDFFREHKAAIAKTVGDADVYLQESLQNIQESTDSNVSELHNRFVEQSEEFKKILESEKEAYEKFVTELNAKFTDQIARMPHMAKQLEEISTIPAQLDKLVDKIEKSNSKLSQEIAYALKNSWQTAKVNSQLGGESEVTFVNSGESSPSWMKWGMLSALIVIALACIFNVVVYFFPLKSETSVPANVERAEQYESPWMSYDSVAADTVAVEFVDTIL